MQLIGISIGVLLVLYLKTWLEIRHAHRIERWLKSLSPDKEYELFHGGYILYANGSRWYLELFTRWKLVWLPESDGDDYEKIINSGRNVEFQSTWLPQEKMYKMVKRIIFTHPNLDARGFWKIIKFFD